MFRVALESVLGLRLNGGREFTVRALHPGRLARLRAHLPSPRRDDALRITVREPTRSRRQPRGRQARRRGGPDRLRCRARLDRARRPRAFARDRPRPPGRRSMTERRMEMAPAHFPDDFLWGAATSAYQIEGSPLADGAGPSIWHRFAHTPGRTANGRDGRRRLRPLPPLRRGRRDLMRDLGLNAYRFSLAWGRDAARRARARSTRRGSTSTRASSIALLGRGIAPLVTLYHWDLPAALDDRGGWLQSRRRRLVRRLRARWCSGRSATASDVGHAQRAVGGDGRRLPARRPRPGARERRPRRAIAVAQPPARPREAVCAPSAPAARGQIGLVVNLEPKDAGFAIPGRTSTRAIAPIST